MCIFNNSAHRGALQRAPAHSQIIKPCGRPDKDHKRDGSLRFHYKPLPPNTSPPPLGGDGRVVGLIDRWLDGWIDQSVDGWADGWMDGYMDGDGLDGWVGRSMGGWLVRWVDLLIGSVDGCIDRCVDGWIDRWEDVGIDRWVDGCVDR